MTKEKVVEERPEPRMDKEIAELKARIDRQELEIARLKRRIGSVIPDDEPPTREEYVAALLRGDMHEALRMYRAGIR
mgnify:CR=1 FL=1